MTFEAKMSYRNIVKQTSKLNGTYYLLLLCIAFNMVKVLFEINIRQIVTKRRTAATADVIRVI
jgi:hypothetical protein